MNYYINLIVLIFIPFSIVSEAKKTTNLNSKIIEIKRTLSLNNEKRHYKEFYINAGKNKGLKKNHIIPVVRRKSFYDPLLNKSLGDLWLPIGEVKIIHVGHKLSVARIYKVPGRKNLPEVEYPTFMIGDRIQIKKAKYITNKKNKSKTARLRKRLNNKRGIASVPNQKTNNKRYTKNLKNKLSFSSKILEEIGKPTNFDSGSKSGGSSSAKPTFLTEGN